MTNSKTTKRALFSSVVALLLCFTMLLGTTFAWFTDNASTSVNSIQAGTLDIQLLDATGNTLEGKTLAWQKAAGHESDTVLWAPGCTYNLQPITIKNNGNLALKYKIEITGIQGSAKLNEVIDWTITNSNTVSDLGADHSLAAGASDTLTISGTMKTTAGNDYQGLTIDGIAIKVLATQDTVEYDSNNNQYDKDATYDGSVNPGTPNPPAGITVSNETELLAAIANASTDAANPTVINLASNVEVSEQIMIPAGKFVEINGGGNTISRAAGSTANPVIRIEGNANITDLTVDAKADDANVSRAVYVTATANAVLTNCNITGAYNAGYGGAMQVYGNVTLDGCVISGNTAKVAAGVNVASGGTLNVKNTTITDNTNINLGGNSIQAANATVNISNSTLADDNALYLRPEYAPLTYTITGDVAINYIDLAYGNTTGQPVPEIFVTSALEKDLVFYVYHIGELIDIRTLLKGTAGYTLTDADLAHVKVYFKDSVTTDYTLYDASNATYELVVQDNRIEFVKK